MTIAEVPYVGEANNCLPPAALLEPLAGASIVFNRDWQMTYLNNRALQIFQQSREKLLYKTIWEIFPNLLSSTFYQRSILAAQTQIPIDFEEFFSSIGRWLLIYIHPSTENIVVYAQDITERKQAQERDLFLATRLANVKDSVIATDLEGKITYWNKGATAIFGYTEDEMLGNTNAVLYPDMDMTSFVRDLQLILEGQDYVGEWKGRHKNGSAIWVDIKTTVLRDMQGHSIGFIGVSKDVTERKRLIDELSKLAAIIESSDDSIIGIALDGKITSWNKGAECMYGYSAQESIGKQITQLFLPANEDGVT